MSSPVVQRIIEDFAKKQGVERREISDQEIVERTLYTMVNEGAKILEEGIAQRASDIDVVGSMDTAGRSIAAAPCFGRTPREWTRSSRG